MAVRSIWRGAIKLSLISIPVRLYPATSSKVDVSFRQYHRRCRTPIQMKKWCPHCDEEVESDDIVKGHKTSGGRVVFAEADEIKKLRPDRSRTLTISDVMTASVIDPRFIERVYYLAPDSREAGSAFDVVHAALDDRAAVGRLAMHGREYLAAIVAGEGDAMLVYTLRTAGEVLASKKAADLTFAGGRVNAREVKLARQVLDSLESDADLSAFADNYQERLRELLKKKGVGVSVNDGKKTADGDGKVVNLMDALRQSLKDVRADTRRTSGTSRKTSRSSKGRPTAARKAS